MSNPISSNPFTSANVYLDTQGLAGLKREAAAQNPEALKAVAKQFEALFIQQMLKAMRDAQLGEGMFDNEQSELYQDMYDKQLSLNLSAGEGFGLADRLYQQLKLSETRSIATTGEPPIEQP